MFDETAHEVTREDQPTALPEPPASDSGCAELDPYDYARARRRAALRVLTELSDEIGYW